MSFCIISASSIKPAQLTMSRAETICPFQALPQQQHHGQIKHCCCFKPLSFEVAWYSEINHLNMHLSVQFFQLLIQYEQMPEEDWQVLQVTSVPPFSPGSQPHKSCFQNPIFVSHAPEGCQTLLASLLLFSRGRKGEVAALTPGRLFFFLPTFTEA